MQRLPRLFILALALAFLAPSAAAQYFGRNKVQYDDFDFRVLRTEHFEIHYYPESEQKIWDVARMAERWYSRHSQTFGRVFEKRKPLIFYANDADFHQTNVTNGFIGEGTGGFTEPLKERVVMPLTGIYAATDHVVGHELVHSFQFDYALHGPDSARVKMQALPLWLIEGTAEYLSVGRHDPHTAMWLRDAALRDDLPTITQLTTQPNRYFPYRYGQAYMAYIGGKYGDQAVAELYRTGGRAGLDSAFVYTLGITPDSLSQEWIAAVKRAYLPLTVDRTPAADVGRLVLAKSIDAGNVNLAPSLSPDGRFVAFLSERDLLSFNLFVADAETGRVLEDLGRSGTRSHFDALRFIASAGSWSPDGKQFAFVTFADGDNEIAIMEARTGKISRRIAVADVGAISNAAWSPDGSKIAFSGIRGGISDLYVLDLDTEQVRRLTQDRYADLQPAWSPDGRTIAFVTDRGPRGTDFETLRYAEMRLGLLSVANRSVEVLEPFEGALHTNPQYAPDGRSLYFLSDQDGFKDLYRYELATGARYRVTRLQTGISGITALAPALTVAQQSGRVMFSVYTDGNYHVYALEADEAQGEPVLPEAMPLADDTAPVSGSATGSASGEGPALAATLPPHRPAGDGLVGGYLDDPLTGLPTGTDYTSKKYKARLGLDFIAPPTVGVSVGGRFGTGLAGGVGFFFSDMLGNHNLAVAASVNGTFQDIGGQVAYVNQANRLNWGVSASHIPLRFNNAFFGVDGQGNLVLNSQISRIFIDQLDLTAAYPLSTTRRLEFSIGGTRYGFNTEIEQFGVIPGFGSVPLDNGFSQSSDPLYFAQASVALVGDNAQFGFTSPVSGARYRFGITPFVGSHSYVQVRADYRRYLRLRPFTLAVRGLHVGNYGGGEKDDPSTPFDESLFTEQYLGFSNTFGFVRGYSFRSFATNEECTPTANGSCAQIDRLVGSRIALASLELRVPLLGVRPLSLISFPYLPTEVAFFFDAGLAWNSDDNPLDLLAFTRDSARRAPVTSAGVSTRFNFFGATMLEVFYAYPFQRPQKGGHFGIQFVPGW